MKKWLSIVLVIVVLTGLLGGCGPKRWGSFNDFFDALDSAKNAGSVKALLSGYDYDSNKAEAAESFSFEGLNIADAQWGGIIYVSIDDKMKNIGATLRSNFDDEQAQEEYYQEAVNLLAEDYGQPSEGFFDDGREYLEWQYDDTSFTLSQEDNKIVLMYMLFTMAE